MRWVGGLDGGDERAAVAELERERERRDVVDEQREARATVEPLQRRPPEEEEVPALQEVSQVADGLGRGKRRRVAAVHDAVEQDVGRIELRGKQVSAEVAHGVVGKEQLPDRLQPFASAAFRERPLLAGVDLHPSSVDADVALPTWILPAARPRILLLKGHAGSVAIPGHQSKLPAVAAARGPVVVAPVASGRRRN